MGQEQRCVATYQGQFSEGKALLETDELLFRGDFRLKIPLPAISSVRAEDGELHVAFGGETAAFVLGRQAARWKERIENPPSLLDKLGIRPGDVVSVVEIDDEPFLAQVQARTGRTIAGSAVAGSDLVFLGAESIADLEKLDALRNYLTPSGGIWVVAPASPRRTRRTSS